MRPPKNYDGRWWPELGPRGVAWNEGAPGSRFWGFYVALMVIGWFFVIPGALLEMGYYWHCARMCRRHGWIKTE